MILTNLKKNVLYIIGMKANLKKCKLLWEKEFLFVFQREIYAGPVF